ncbi:MULTISPECIES: DUF1963 domain-containing protein [Streptomyces]|uniref:DUF1963 domain-containing protein n=1 Tax=Streptomyces griseorubens TaxID=66897 RepID=A0ABR4SV78_9ACTN|nr:DUF1963 domain-containing protein [Streptomyces griseorubens]KEG39112.1 hypothetical protein DJ64_17105 [Streptomyces griseorubens]
MISELRERLRPFHDEALAQGIPADDVDRWVAVARPCATLTPSEDGPDPVVGRFGGPLALPDDVPTPGAPFVASIDLAALPAGATDLPLPPDGRLLFFAWPEGEYPDSAGQVVYVPAGATVTERDKHTSWNPGDVDEYRAMFDSYPQGPLRARIDVSLPYHSHVTPPGERHSVPVPGHPRAEELVEVWEEVQDDIAPSGPFQLGGYADEEAVYVDPVETAVETVAQAVKSGSWDGPVSSDPADWVLLADWYAGEDVRLWEGSTVHWVIQREDLAARRFDRAFATVFWNP